MNCAICDWPMLPSDLSADTPTGEICTCCAFDLLRWRKWSEEKPKNSGQYLVRWNNESCVLVTDYDLSAEVRWKHCISPPTYWRPIGPLPGGDK